MGEIPGYLPGFGFFAPGKWDPFKIHNIANSEVQLKIPNVFLIYFPLMASKSGPVYVADC